MGLYAERMSALGSENAFSLIAKIARVEASGKKVVRLNIGEPDFNSADTVNRVAIAEITKSNSHYCEPAGLLPLREAIARHVNLTRGLDVTPDHVIVTPGAKPPIAYSVLAYVNPGDEVVYPSPGYQAYESWTTFMGAKAVPLHLREDRGFALRPEDLAACLSPRTKLIILNSPSNPTGGVLSREDLDAIAGHVRERCSRDTRILSDEIYEHILFDGLSHHSITGSPDMAERTVLVSGFSKSFAMTGWRLGYAVLPTREEAQVFRQLNINVVSCLQPFIQLAGVEALVSEESMEQLQRMVESFRERRDLVLGLLSEIPYLRATRPRGAFYIFVNVAEVCGRIGATGVHEQLEPSLRARTAPATLLQLFLLSQHRVATLDRRSFGTIGSEGQHYLRLSIATSVDDLREGIERLKRGFEDRSGFERFVSVKENWL